MTTMFTGMFSHPKADFTMPMTMSKMSHSKVLIQHHCEVCGVVYTMSPAWHRYFHTHPEKGL